VSLEALSSIPRWKYGTVSAFMYLSLAKPVPVQIWKR
jgi:hypothetical protein